MIHNYEIEKNQKFKLARHAVSLITILPKTSHENDGFWCRLHHREASQGKYRSLHKKCVKYKSAKHTILVQVKRFAKKKVEKKPNFGRLKNFFFQN